VNQPEDLYTEAVRVIAARVYSACLQDGGLLDHFYETIWTDSTELLHRLGLIAPFRIVRGDEVKTSEREYTISVPLNAVAGHVAALSEDQRVPLDEILTVVPRLESWLANGLPTTREAFSVPKEHETLLRLMSLNGYAEWTGAGFRWTDRIAPNMIAAGCWDEGLFSVRDSEEAGRAKMLKSARRALPPGIANRLRKTNSMIEKTRIVLYHWDGEDWRATPLGNGERRPLTEAKWLAEQL
jgi:hypothetical protein